MGLYRGIGPTVVGILPYAGLKFYVYQSLKQQYRAATGRDEEHRLPVPLMLTFGAISGLIGQVSEFEGPHAQLANWSAAAPGMQLDEPPA